MFPRSLPFLRNIAATLVLCAVSSAPASAQILRVGKSVPEAFSFVPLDVGMRTGIFKKYGVDIEFHCKPLGDTDWNGSGMHANFSTTYMREVGGKEYFEKLMDAFKANRADHIAVYGPDNHMRLTGKHETASIDSFSWGVADRGASIRVPHSFVNNGYKGYLEDRRPNSQGDPYQIASQILKTVAEVPTDAKAAAA